MIKPILYKPEMVKSIFNETKTQTRRIIIPQPRISKGVGKWIKNNNIQMLGGKEVITAYMEKNCPYGSVGDILWVRESWKYLGQDEDGDNLVMFKDGTKESISYSGDREDYWINKCEKLVEKMDKKGAAVYDEENDWITWDHKNVPWTPSIHMPKDVCRLFLKIKNIRVENLQDISEKDAVSEGIEEIHPAPFLIRWKNYRTDIINEEYCENPYHSFQSLWESINGSESWEENPWVWVIEFEKTEMPKGFI